MRRRTLLQGFVASVVATVLRPFAGSTLGHDHVSYGLVREVASDGRALRELLVEGGPIRAGVPFMVIAEYGPETFVPVFPPRSCSVVPVSTSAGWVVWHG